MPEDYVEPRTGLADQLFVQFDVLAGTEYETLGTDLQKFRASFFTTMRGRMQVAWHNQHRTPLPRSVDAEVRSQGYS